MNKQRFNEFKKYLEQGFGLIVQAYPNTSDFVNNIGRDLILKYPELQPEQEPQQKQTASQRKEKVAQQLRLSFDDARFKDYQDIECSLKRNNPEECVYSVNLL